MTKRQEKAISKKGRQSWVFVDPPHIISGAAVVGPKEGNGKLHDDFDYIYDSLSWGNNSFEKCEQEMQEKAVRLALAKASVNTVDMDLMFAGDLINQITPSGFTARALGIPYFGLFTACATMGEALALSALSCAGGAARYALAAACSHTCTAEKQFRYPNEYGAQKPPYSQQTATAAGAAVIGEKGGKVQISAVTVGRVIDEKVCDPFQMGAAMAPAFADTVAAHMQEMKRSPGYYDAIISGDLGRIGVDIAAELLRRQNIDMGDTEFLDCGLLLYEGDSSVFAGGSGCGCSAAVGMSHLLRRIGEGELKRILLCPTGALLSPVSTQQKESIPTICHAIVLEGVE